MQLRRPTNFYINTKGQYKSCSLLKFNIIFLNLKNLDKRVKNCFFFVWTVKYENCFVDSAKYFSE